MLPVFCIVRLTDTPCFRERWCGGTVARWCGCATVQRCGICSGAAMRLVQWCSGADGAAVQQCSGVCGVCVVVQRCVLRCCDGAVLRYRGVAVLW